MASKRPRSDTKEEEKKDMTTEQELEALILVEKQTIAVARDRITQLRNQVNELKADELVIKMKILLESESKSKSKKPIVIVAYSRCAIGKLLKKSMDNRTQLFPTIPSLEIKDRAGFVHTQRVERTSRDGLDAVEWSDCSIVDDGECPCEQTGNPCDRTGKDCINGWSYKGSDLDNSKCTLVHIDDTSLNFSSDDTITDIHEHGSEYEIGHYVVKTWIAIAAHDTWTLLDKYAAKTMCEKRTRLNHNDDD